jgi:hypothetical protein
MEFMFTTGPIFMEQMAMNRYFSFINNLILITIYRAKQKEIQINLLTATIYLRTIFGNGE